MGVTLRDVAEAIEMHESTVSRVASNKYMATPRGIFELKYFFTTAIHATLRGPIVTACPASILRTHPHAHLYLDAESAALLD